MNRLSGHIAAIEASGSIALVDVSVGRHVYTALLLGAGDTLAAWQVGAPAVLLFKETEVALAKNLSGTISLRNRFKGVVVALEAGDILTKVTFDANGHIISSIITSRSFHALQIAIGDEVEGLVKANEMTLNLDMPVCPP